MQSEIETLCLQYIADEWHKLLPLKLRHELPIPPPRSVWIRLYDPISNRDNVISASRHTLRKAWFLTEAGIEQQDSSEYMRFVATNTYPQAAIWGIVHKVALAAFANFLEEPRAIYLETQWGHRWGQGYQMMISPAGSLEIEKTLWLS